MQETAQYIFCHFSPLTMSKADFKNQPPASLCAKMLSTNDCHPDELRLRRIHALEQAVLLKTEACKRWILRAHAALRMTIFTYPDDNLIRCTNVHINTGPASWSYNPNSWEAWWRDRSGDHHSRGPIRIRQIRHSSAHILQRCNTRSTASHPGIRI